MEPSWINDWLDQPQPPLPLQTPDPRVWASIQARIGEPVIPARWLWMTAAGFALLLGLNLYMLQQRPTGTTPGTTQDQYAAVLTAESQNDLYP